MWGCFLLKNSSISSIVSHFDLKAKFGTVLLLELVLPFMSVSLLILSTKNGFNILGLGGFTNIVIKQSQCFYCALDLKIEAGLTPGSRRTYGKSLVFVCLRGDEWPVSTR